MKDLLKTLASQKLAIGILVLLLLALGAGTIVETLRGAEEAGRTVYRSWWLFGLLQLLCASVLASAYLHYPWGKQRWGYAATHLGVALILFGAGVTYRYGTDGDLVIWKGETANEVVKRDTQGKILQHARLPFYVQLDDFRVEQYPGTQQPSGYHSDLQIIDPQRGTFGAAIWMNHGLSHQDWNFYQSSYRFEEDGRVASVLSASSDPGRIWVFTGYCVLLAGMGLVLVTRISQQRKPRVLSNDVSPQKKDRLTLALAFVIVFAVIFGVIASTRHHQSNPNTEALRRLPVQHDGRIMPLDTLARESVSKITGQSTWQDTDPVESTLRWLADAEKTSKATILRCLPPAPESDAWTPSVSVQRADLLALATGPRLPHWPSASSIERELTYNRVQPTRLSWIVLAGAFLLAALGWLRKQRLVDHLALAGLVIGTAMMTWGLAVRWQIAGRIPASNMHESLLFLAWGVGFVALLLFPWMRNRMVIVNATGLSAVTMLLNNRLPIDPFIHPMPPVLAGTPWLAIHVPIIMLSYSILALGMVVAHAQLAIQTVAPARIATIENLYRTLYWYIHVGCWLLAAGIITGSIWAASSWGRYWGWDPKEVWSLVALLAYLAILHGRIEKLVGPFGVAAFSILAFQTILMTYLGVNFVLGTGMHSYAMGDSPVAKWMLLVAAVEGAFLFWVWVARKRRGTTAENVVSLAKESPALDH